MQHAGVFQQHWRYGGKHSSRRNSAQDAEGGSWRPGRCEAYSVGHRVYDQKVLGRVMSPSQPWERPLTHICPGDILPQPSQKCMFLWIRVPAEWRQLQCVKCGTQTFTNESPCWQWSGFSILLNGPNGSLVMTGLACVTFLTIGTMETFLHVTEDGQQVPSRNHTRKYASPYTQW